MDGDLELAYLVGGDAGWFGGSRAPSDRIPEVNIHSPRNPAVTPGCLCRNTIPVSVYSGSSRSCSKLVSTEVCVGFRRADCVLLSERHCGHGAEGRKLPSPRLHTV